MKKLLLETSFSKIYMIAMIIITLLILGGYFSYAMFTVSKEKGNAISIVTGNLEYRLTVDEEETNKLTVEPNTTKTFTITLSNPNNIKARFNFYYIGSLPTNVKAGYIVEEEINVPPLEVGTNLEKLNTAGSSNTYIIRVSNKSNSQVTITLGVEVGLDYNDLSLKDNGHLFEEIKTTGPVSEIIIDNLENGDIYDDGEDTFITGEDPNNYIWYSGKLWRAVSVNDEEKTTKLVTQWGISGVTYNVNNNTAFEGSYMEEWLNDTTVDGFLGNLRDYERFIKLDSKWNATMMSDASKPESTTIVEDPVGLLNLYEYTMSYSTTDATNGYLNIGHRWWVLTPLSSSRINIIETNGGTTSTTPVNSFSIRPSINLKPDVKIVDGNGTEEDPYRLEGDNDTVSSGTLLKDRYSGEYLTFGTGENNLYRIVSHENGSGTKITSAEPLKDSETFKTTSFGNSINYSSSNTIGSFLNNEYLDTSNGYLTNKDINMIEDSTTWYLGMIEYGDNYKLGKYTGSNMSSVTQNTTTSKVGLLRMGELMSSQTDILENNTAYWLLTPFSDSTVRYASYNGSTFGGELTLELGIKPTLNLKQNVVITSGDGTKTNPFQLSVQ